MSEQKQSFEGGATRTVQAGRYDLIPSALLDAVARRLALGAQKHGENNWRRGGPEFMKATVSHALKHLADYAERGDQDDLDGAVCNLAFLCHFAAQPPQPPLGALGALGALVASVRDRRVGDAQPVTEQRDAFLRCEVCGVRIQEAPRGWAHLDTTDEERMRIASKGCRGFARPEGWMVGTVASDELKVTERSHDAL